MEDSLEEPYSSCSSLPFSFWPFWRCAWGHCLTEKCAHHHQFQIPQSWAVSGGPKSSHTCQNPSSPHSLQVSLHHSSPYTPIPQCSCLKSSIVSWTPLQSTSPSPISTPTASH